tara:strand:- start:43 stop:570 length:528 start_codon:yes stop_codon:yes gene_type:complete
MNLIERRIKQLYINDSSDSEVHDLAKAAYDPDNAQACYLLGLSYGLSDKESALPFLSRATQLDPENPEYAGDLGAVLFKLDRIMEAERLFKRAEQLDPRNGQFDYWLACIAEKRGERERARILYSSSINKFRTMQDRCEEHERDFIRAENALAGIFQEDISRLYGIRFGGSLTIG